MSEDLDNLVFDSLEDEAVSRLSQGKLSFNEAPELRNATSEHIKSWATVKREFSFPDMSLTNGDAGPKQGLKFEVVSARTVDTENVKKHVAYTIMVRKDGPHHDSKPAVIERRYSDFLILYESLRRDFPSQMSGFIFPKKVFMGNFGPGVISERSAGFEGLLEHVSNDHKLKDSDHFMAFLQEPEKLQARQCMQAQRYDQALPLLENTFRLLNKFYTDRHPAVMIALCNLVACSNSNPKAFAAERYAELALRRFEAVSDADLLQFYVPLLQLCVHLWWLLGRDKRQLETQLEDMKRRGIKVDGAPTLLDALMALDEK